MLINTIKADRMAAMKARDAARVSILTTLFSEASRPGLDDGKRLSTDAEVVQVCKKFVKSITETITNMKERNQVAELAAYELELDIVNGYIPKQMNEDELRSVIVTFVESNPGCNMGQVMKHLKANHDGLYDGRAASTLAKAVI